MTIRNLVEYIVIVGFTNWTAESLHVLKPTLLHGPGDDGPRGKAEAVFEKFGPSEEAGRVDAKSNATSTHPRGC